MRDRLIKELDSADLFLRNRANSSPAPLNDYDIEEMLDIAKICDEAARALEKAIVPPCKVGDTLYVISQMRDKRILPFINKRKVLVVELKKRSCIVYSEGEYLDAFSQDDFGKTVFLTREEAEKKLREGV